MCPLPKAVLVAALTVALGAATFGVLVSGAETLDRLHRVVAPVVHPLVHPESAPPAPVSDAEPTAPDLPAEYEGGFRDVP